MLFIKGGYPELDSQLTNLKTTGSSGEAIFSAVFPNVLCLSWPLLFLSQGHLSPNSLFHSAQWWPNGSLWGTPSPCILFVWPPDQCLGSTRVWTLSASKTNCQQWFRGTVLANVTMKRATENSITAQHAVHNRVITPLQTPAHIQIKLPQKCSWLCTFYASDTWKCGLVSKKGTSEHADWGQ